MSEDVRLLITCHCTINWSCRFAPGICMNSRFGKMSPPRACLAVQNEPKALMELFSPLDIKFCSYPLAKNKGLHFLLRKSYATPLTLVSHIIVVCKELDLVLFAAVV